MKSWKTTAGAIVVGACIVLFEIADLLGVPLGDLSNAQFDPQLLIAGLGALGIGWFARDNDKTSEDVAAK